MLSRLKRNFRAFIEDAVITAISRTINRQSLFDVETAARLIAATESAQFFITKMPTAPNLVTQTDLLLFAIEKVTAQGLWLEFGVYKGATLGLIALNTDGRVYGFDSFEGLPVDWTHFQRKGRFSLDGKGPKQLPDNVQLVKGWFESTLPVFLEEHTEAVAFVHIDCDVYSSTKTVLEHLRKQISSGTIIVFDEFFNYPQWKLNEFRAFNEFVENYNVEFEYIGFASSHHSVAVRINRIDH